MDDVKIGEILEPGDEDTRRDRENRVRGKFWKTVGRAARQVPFMEDLVAAYYCAFDLETPHRVRGILLAALAYFVLPIDGIPDFLAFVGFSDDVAVLTVALAAIRAHITPAHYEAARAALRDAGMEDSAESNNV
ncbi:MAG: DUF1232 domain-containing protein [Hyphomicrobiales bacterium]|nr:DUF1232 domain-containing protein [Hyphomicrobiales bacterium]MCP4997320.1 DUF1232 domain-containing protein [Hyphomicrobiales bacterium]